MFNSTQELLDAGTASLALVDEYLVQMRAALLGRLMAYGKSKSAGLEKEQFAAHGMAWSAAYIEALHAMQDWAVKLNNEKSFSDIEQLIYQCAFGSYLSQLTSAIAMSQDEVFRPMDLDLEDAATSLRQDSSINAFIKHGNSIENRMQIVRQSTELIKAGEVGHCDDNEELRMVRDQFRRLADESIIPDAPSWHDNDELIPMSLIELLAEMGVFGVCIPEEYGGQGLSKIMLCVITEELSRGYIGVGSLGTRSEIAAELILSHGTKEQKEHYLPRIASGECIPTAVFTEPNTGSDLASLQTRALATENGYAINGNKIWITHAARADLMTLLARTGDADSGYRGLSMFLLDKPRGNNSDDFPIEGLSGGEIPVLGYRGMKEYELAFDNFRAASNTLLGETEGQGFKQLMSTFELARIQTAARAIGVGQSALELAFSYAMDRKQFGKATVNFPRVAGKLGWMITELMIMRQVTYRAARKIDTGVRSDVEAGMSKLLAARCAWSCADNALQIHGGNGYALEYPISRILCDARILNIFEGAAEIQAQVIARGLLDREN